MALRNLNKCLRKQLGTGGLRIKDVIMQLLRKAGALGKRILTSLNPLTRYSLPLPISLRIIVTLSARLHQGGEMHSGFYHRKTIHPEPSSGGHSYSTESTKRTEGSQQLLCAFPWLPSHLHPELLLFLDC